MEAQIKVKSSSTSEIYDVVFKIENGLTSINCNCKAGFTKTLCKHRLNLLDGDISSLANPSESTSLAQILAHIDKKKIANLYIELNKVEADLKKMEATRKKLKKEIGVKFSDGF